METFTADQLAAIASANKTVAWVFRVVDNLSNEYHWSTSTYAASGAGEWEVAHAFKIVNFSGITLRRNKSESGIHAPNDVSFSIPNAGNALDAVNFTGGLVIISLIIIGAAGTRQLCGSWKFSIKSASPYAQQIDVMCEDFVQKYLKGSYPNTRLISDIFPVADGVAADTLCIPEPYGTCYIPLRSVYAGADRYYILSSAVGYPITIEEVRSPRELGAKIVWTSAGFPFPQSVVQDATFTPWRMFQAMIAGGAAGIFMSGDRILDVPTKFSRSDTASVTDPAAIINRVLLNMGAAAGDIDAASFAAATAIFASWGLAWNFAFFYKEDRAVVLARLLAMCHSCLIPGEKIRLQVLSKVSQKTITTFEVTKPQEVGADTFKYTDAIAERVSDSGYVAFQQTGESQDQFLKIRVPAKSATDVIDAEVVTFPGVQDTQQVQKLGTLYYQRKFLKAADISFTGKGTLLALRPDDVITIDDTDYGGTYAVLIDEITINPDVSVSIAAIRFSEVLDDWADLAPPAITIASDTPTTAYSPVISGPDSVPSSGQMPNSLPGRLRVGQSADYVLLEPVSPLRVSLYSADVERLRIGNLNGFLGYVTDVYGIGVGDASKYFKYDPANGISLGGSGVPRIELDLELARISVKDATNFTKTAMGYLNGLAKHDGTGNWGPGDYGFWAATGDHLKIDGDAVYKSGDWIVENDGSYLIQNAAAQTIIRLGTVSGVKGLYLYDASTPTQNLLAKFTTAEVFIGDVANYFQYTIANLKVQAGYTAPGDNSTTPGAGLKIDAGKIEVYGLDHSFGGTVISSDGNYMAVIGKFLTATGLTKRYPLNNSTNFTPDGQMYVYYWNTAPATDTWVEIINIGKKTIGSDAYAIYSDGEGAGLQRGAYLSGINMGLWSDSINGIGVVGASVNGYGGKFSGDTAPVTLSPSPLASAPSNTAEKGSLHVTSGGILYINKDDGTTWEKVGAQDFPTSAAELVWRYTMPDGSPVYSSPIRGTVRDAGGTAYDAIVLQSWDWYLYALKITDGTLIWRTAFGGTSYGRPQMADVNGDGYNEIFGSAHDGIIRSLTDQGSVRWEHSNLYDREGTGTATNGGSTYLVDTTKDWVPNSFLRFQGPGFNASIEILSGTGSGQIREIESVYSSTRLDIITAWDTNPDATSVYRINPMYDSDKYFMHAGTLSHESGVWYLYVTGFDGQCVKLNADTGAIIWRFSTLENIEPYPLIVDIDGDSNLECLVSSVDGTCYALNASTGAVVWSTHVTDEGLDAFLNYGDIDNDSALEVIVNSRFNRVHVLNGVTGEQKYVSVDTGGDLDSRPLLITLTGGWKDIVVAGDSGLIYKFSVVTGSPYLKTEWRYMGSPGPNSISEYNSSPSLVNIGGQDKILVFDMLGTGIILTLDGAIQGYIFATGGVEGTPILADFDSDGKTEMVLTTTDGHVEMYRFP